MKNTKILNIVVGVVMVLGLILWVRTVMNGDSLKGNADLQASVLNPLSYLTALLLLFAAGSSFVFSIANLVKNPEVLKRTLFGVLFLAAILIVAYLVSPDNAVTNLRGEELASTTVSKWVSTGIWYSVFLLGVGLIFFVVDFAKSLVK